MVYNYVLLTVLIYMGFSQISGYNHDEFKHDASAFLDAEIQELTDRKINSYDQEQIIETKLVTLSRAAIDAIIKANERKVFDFVQDTLTTDLQEDAKYLVWTLCNEVLNSPNLFTRVGVAVKAWLKQASDNVQKDGTLFAYSPEREREVCRPLDVDFIAQLAHGITVLNESDKNMMKAYILKEEADFFFGEFEIVGFHGSDEQGMSVYIPTYELHNSQRRAHVVDAITDKQLAYLVYKVWLSGSGSVVYKVGRMTILC